MTYEELSDIDGSRWIKQVKCEVYRERELGELVLHTDVIGFPIRPDVAIRLRDALVELFPMEKCNDKA